MLENLITDRTEADYLKAAAFAAKSWDSMTDEEKSEWLKGLKGAYNASDMNRVTEAAQYIAELLKKHGYAVRYVPVEIEKGRTAWINSDIPRSEQMRGYLANIEAVRSVLAMPKYTPKTPESAENMTWSDANDIEKILFIVGSVIEKMTSSRFRSGEVFSGEF